MCMRDDRAHWTEKLTHLLLYRTSNNWPDSVSPQTGWIYGCSDVEQVEAGTRVLLPARKGLLHWVPSPGSRDDSWCTEHPQRRGPGHGLWAGGRLLQD